MALKKPESGKKPVVGDRNATSDSHPAARVSVQSARGGQHHTRPVVKAPEKSTKPVTGGGVRSTTGKTKSKNRAKDPTIP